MSVRSLRRGSIAASRVEAAGGGTYTLYPDADGYLTAGSNDGPAVFVDEVDIGVGQYNGGRLVGFLSFDTSGVAGTITAVTLSLWAKNDNSVTDFTMEARLHDWGGTLEEADWVAGSAMSAKTLLASKATAGLGTGAYKDFTSEAAFLTNINQAGSTRFLLVSSRMVAGTAPSGNEFVIFESMEATDMGPKLVIETS